MYSPTVAQVPGLTQKHLSRIETAFSTNGIDLMGAYAITDRLAIEGSLYLRWERLYNDSTLKWADGSRVDPDSIRYLRTLPSIGLAYTVPLENGHHFFLSASAGYGKGRLKMSERDMSDRDANGIPPAHFTQYYASMQRIYLQPAFLIHYDHIQVITSLRWSEVRYGFRHGTTMEPFGVFPHRNYHFLEAAMTIRVSPPGAEWLAVDMQGGAAAGDATFHYHHFIGNIGVSIDPVSLFGGGR